MHPKRIFSMAGVNYTQLSFLILPLSLLQQTEIYAIANEQVPYENYIFTTVSLGTTMVIRDTEFLPLLHIMYSIFVSHTDFHSFCKNMFVLFYTVDMNAHFILYITRHQHEAFGLLMSVAFFDVGSYFGGKYFGKLAFSSVSPDKTIDGVVCGKTIEGCRLW